MELQNNESRKAIQLWLKQRDQNQMIQTFTELVDQHGLDTLKRFRRQKTKNENAILHELVHDGKDSVVKFLVEQYDFDKNVQRSSDLNTPLHLAQWYDQQGVVKVLLDMRADVGITNRYGEIPFQTALVPPTINAMLTGAKDAPDILKLVDERFNDFEDDSLMYAFWRLGVTTSDYDVVACKYVSSDTKRTKIQTSVPYQRLSEALTALACQPKDGSVWPTLLKAMTSFPDERLLNAMFVAMHKGNVSCQDWPANHIASYIYSLAKLEVSTRQWGWILATLCDALHGQTESLHEGDIIKVLWALGQMRFQNDALLVACTRNVLESHDQMGKPGHRLCMATWAHIRTSCHDEDLLHRLAEAIKEHLPDMTVHMDVTLPAWSFAKAGIADEDLYSAIFEKASITAYESISRHHARVTRKEMLMSWVQLYIVYKHCRANCPAALQALSNRLRDDLHSISEHRSGNDCADFLSQTSSLQDPGTLAELNRMIEGLESDAGIQFEESMEEGCMPKCDVMEANAAMSRNLLGNVPDSELVAQFVVLEFKRDPQPFHAALLQGTELCDVRQALEREGHIVQLESGTKVFSRPEVYQHACQIASDLDLKPRHVVTEIQFEESVMATITRLPSKLDVRLKSKRENHWICTSKMFPADTQPDEESSAHTPFMLAVSVVKAAMTDQKQGALESAWTSKLSDGIRDLAQIDGKLCDIISEFGWTGIQFQSPPNLKDLLFKLQTGRIEDDEQETTWEVKRTFVDVPSLSALSLGSQICRKAKTN
jgi:hypothetical protein